MFLYGHIAQKQIYRFCSNFNKNCNLGKCMTRMFSNVNKLIILFAKIVY